MKIGRNDPCPCGSGKKYKKCCIDKPDMTGLDDVDINIEKLMSAFSAKSHNEEKEDISPLLSYSKTDILSAVSYLQAIPQNHGKYVRLEKIQYNLCVSNAYHDDKKMTPSELRSFFSQHFRHDYQEDPPENLFTENIMTPMGNRIIFPGLAQGQQYYLQQLINVVSMGDFEWEFAKSCLSPALILLSISDYIARALGYERNMRGVDGESNDIFVPDDLCEKEGLFRIPSSTMIKIARSCQGSISDIAPFLINPQDNTWSGVVDENPLIHRPILYNPDADEYIVLSVTNLLYAALNGLLRRVVENSRFDEVLRIYSESCWQHCDFMLYNMGFRKLDYTFEGTHLPIHEGLYIFDTDKIAYVLLINDDGTDFDPDTPLGFFDDKQLDTELADHINAIYQKIKTDEKIADSVVFNIVVSLGIGRPKVTALPRNLGWEVLHINITDLDILSKSGKCNNLTLWNYAIALKDVGMVTPFFLDNISYFIGNNESWYMSDDYTPTIIHISVGNAHDFRADAILKDDLHLFNSGKGYIPLSREKLPALLPIYAAKPFLQSFMAVTPSLGEAVFIEPENSFVFAQDQKERFESEICIAIAYWLFVLSEPLKSRVGTLSRPITIKVNLDDINTGDAIAMFETVDREADLFDKIIIDVSESETKVFLDKYFLFHLISENNHAERVLLQKILYSIWQNSTESRQILDAILDEYMPLSSRKKLLFKVSDYDIRPSLEHITSLLTPSQYAINRELDHLAEILTPKPYTPKDNLDQKTKKSLVNDVVSYFYKKLRNLLQQYNHEDVLRKLMSHYEAAIQKREAHKLEVVPKIECFKDYTDIHSIVATETYKNTEISLTLRCLIEHIVAEPLCGTKRLDIAAFHSCVAYMLHIVNWGFVSDGLNFNITDTEVSLLKSGRIGTDKSFENEELARYKQSKINENIFHERNRLAETFSLPKRGTNEDIAETDYDKAFCAEFKVPFHDSVGITLHAIQLAFDNSDSVSCIKEDDFITYITDGGIIKAETVKSYISSFSLFNRGVVQNVKEHGFRNEDFYPWRYNRKLSLLQKPFIVTQIGEDRYLQFGARALFDYMQNLTTLIYSGRLQAESSEMKSYLSKINNENGKQFTNDVSNFISKQFNGRDVVVHTEVGIKPSGSLKSTEDIGDIDILVIDKDNKRILSIECKHLIEARTPYEMHLELMKFIDGDSPWIPKVDKRNEWILSNKPLFTAFGITNIDDYTFEYIFLTNESISLPFIKANDIKYRFVSFIDLQNDLSLLFPHR